MVELDQFNPCAKEINRVFCTFLDSSISDDDLIVEVGMIDGFNDDEIFDGIIKYHETKKIIDLYLVTHGHINFLARIYIRTNENSLEVKEQIKREDESYSLVTFTITILQFIEYLLYSYTRGLQMNYKEENTPYPERLIFWNIYTNLNMVKIKKYSIAY